MACPAPELPEDLVVEVLLRLPVKALVRFKSVSRSWRSLIESPGFISRHLNRSASRGSGKSGDGGRSLIVGYRCPDTEECRVSLLSGQTLELNTNVEVPPHLPWKIWRIVGCCNGVVCCLSSVGQYLLWNPATREYRIVPESRAFLGYLAVKDGFGYDSAVDDYKIVRIGSALLFGMGNCIRVHVFALSEGSWRVIQIPAPLATYVRYKECVSLGGFLYWRSFSDDDFILSFALRDEVFGRLCYPDRSLIGDGDEVRLAASEESLCLIVFNSTAIDTVVVWVMDGGPGNESWMKRSSIGAVIGIHKPLGFGPNGVILVEKSDGVLAIYEAGKDSVRDLPVQGDPGSLDCHSYIESLVRVRR